MAKQTNLYLPAATDNQSVTLVNADGTAAKTLFTAGADDSDVIAIIVASNDTAAMNLELAIKRGGTAYPLTTVNIPAASGMGAAGATVPVDLLASTMLPGLPVNSAGKRYIPLEAGDTLEVRVLVAVTAAKTVYVSAFGQDY